MSVRRAVVYVRVSTEDQAENGTSLETQELACLRRAADLGCAVHATFRDEGVSGALYEARDGIQRALAELEAGNADTLIVHSISRLSRDLEHQQAISKRAARAGATLVVCDLPASDTEEGDLMFGITGAFAQYERKLIRRRTMAGSRRVAEKGRQPVRAMEPFGYHIVRKADVLAGRHPAGTEGTYVIDKVQAEIVQTMFRDYARGGLSLYGIATRLNAEQVPTPRGAALWSMQTIAGILKNPVYRGAAGWGRHASVVDETRTARGRKPRYKVLRSEPTVCIPVPPIVDEATWRACQDRMAGNKRLQGGNPSRTFLLSAVARCPVCRRGLTGKRDYATGRRLYRCNRDAFSQHLPMVYFDADALEDYTRQAVIEAASRPEVLRDAHLALQQRSVSDVDHAIAGLQAELTALTKREAAAARAQVDALAADRTAEPYEAILSECAAARAELQKRLSTLQSQTAPNPRTQTPDALSASMDAIAALRRVLESPHLGVREKRSVITACVSSIVPVGTEGVQLTLVDTASTNQKNKNTNQFFIGFPSSSLERLR